MFAVTQGLRRLALPLVAAAAVVGFAAPAGAQVTPADTYNIALVGYNSTTLNAYYLVSPLTAVFGTTQTFAGAGYGGQAVTVTSTQSIANGQVTNFFSFSTPTNFLTGTTVNGEIIDGMELDVGGDFAGTNPVNLLNAISTINGTGLIRYNTSNTLAVTPAVTLGVGGRSYNYYQGISTTSTAGLFQFAIRGFEATLTYAAPVAAVVPEPATWGLMILGFGMAGAALRRRQRVTVRFA